MKQLLRDLGHAINDSVSDSDRIAEAISSVRSAGFDIVLKLDATIGLARRSEQDAKMTSLDRRFLESLHIRVDDETLEEETVAAQRVEIPPQDIKFLKSLKISFDEERKILRCVSSCACCWMLVVRRSRLTRTNEQHRSDGCKEEGSKACLAQRAIHPCRQ